DLVLDAGAADLESKCLAGAGVELVAVHVLARNEAAGDAGGRHRSRLLRRVVRLLFHDNRVIDDNELPDTGQAQVRRYAELPRAEGGVGGDGYFEFHAGELLRSPRPLLLGRRAFGRLAG